MCEKCIEIGKTIERYRRIKEKIADPAFVNRAKELIAELEADKAALHREQKAAQLNQRTRCHVAIQNPRPIRTKADVG